MKEPSIFQREIEKAMMGLIGHGIFMFIEDVIIYSKTLKENEQIFIKVIERLNKYNFKIQIDKYESLKLKVLYLRHILWESM